MTNIFALRPAQKEAVETLRRLDPSTIGTPPTSPPNAIVSYSEAAYFDGYHVQHIADYFEHKRLSRLHKNARDAYRRRYPHIAALWRD